MYQLQRKLISALAVLIVITGCGPETIRLMSGLDTPSHHVFNGNNLLQRGKFEAARQEFARATELDPNYSPAYVGLGLVFGRQGDIDKAYDYMAKAEELASDEEQKADVADGYEELNELKAKAME